MRTRKRGSFAAMMLSSLLLAACNGGSSSTPGQCNPPNGITTALVYPAPGSSGIPDNFGVIVFGSTAALPSGFGAYVVNNSTQNAVLYNTVGVAPSPLPTPNAIPGFANPVYQSSGNPGATFVAGSTITVYLNNANSGCAPTLNLGSFRVQ